ncbi:hypothetical protein BS47DRAFT_1403063 [Hydnum rufescens UP504]|uniref:Uncharacterized protein n=1 Tax=Hydnum rufescens UP504 TaxID=1448309 RepID=A0A9P6DE31_9AGAM|nr:hypothetical protein BS47DRAFT_1403063 [Hydnum rufescens UP504]
MSFAAVSPSSNAVMTSSWGKQIRGFPSHPVWIRLEKQWDNGLAWPSSYQDQDDSASKGDIKTTRTPTDPVTSGGIESRDTIANVDSLSDLDKTSYCLVELHCQDSDVDLSNIIKICFAIHREPKAGRYTLQRFELLLLRLDDPRCDCATRRAMGYASIRFTMETAFSDLG